MNVNATTAIANSTATTPAPASTTGASSSVDKQMFLQLLVTQLKNQDPLSPQDPSQFVAELAQFSSLDQLISINQELGAVTGAQGSGSQASNSAVTTPSAASNTKVLG